MEKPPGIRIRIRGFEKEYDLADVELILPAAAEGSSDGGGGLGGLGGGASSALLLMALMGSSSSTPATDKARAAAQGLRGSHPEIQCPDCSCYGLGAAHAADCPAWDNGRALAEIRDAKLSR